VELCFLVSGFITPKNGANKSFHNAGYRKASKQNWHDNQQYVEAVPFENASQYVLLLLQGCVRSTSFR
jgi:hypothetical protein